MNKKYKTVFIVFLMLLVLAGCKTKENSKPTKTSTTTEQKEPVKTSVKVNQEKDDNIWSSDKEIKLKQFMASWGKEMKQDYTFYGEKDELNWNNQIISKKHLENSTSYLVNGEKQEIAFFPENELQEKLNVVAIASDEEDSDSNNHHLYFFTVKANEAKVFLVSPNSSDNEIILTETENDTLKNTYHTIAFSNKDDNSQLFDALSIELKAVLVTEAIDERLSERFDELNEPEAMNLSYYKENEYLLLFFTSGAGVGHPIYLLSESPSDYQLLQKISRVSYQEYAELPLPVSVISKGQLYDKYSANPKKYETAVTNFGVSVGSNLKESYDNTTQLARATNLMAPETTDTNISTSEPTAEEIFGYYRDFIVGDLPGFTSDLKDYVEMRGIDDQGLPIIKHMRHGSEIEITIDGSIINYSVYTIGGADQYGNIAKTHISDAYYDTVTGNHGIY